MATHAEAAPAAVRRTPLTFAFGAVTALFLTACSSGNPDSLIGTNVDENLAMADGNVASDGNMAANVSSTAEPNPSDSGNLSGRVSNAVAAKPAAPVSRANEEPAPAERQDGADQSEAAEPANQSDPQLQ